MREHDKSPDRPQEFRSLDAYLRYYFPVQQSKQRVNHDIAAAAQQLAATTVRAVRKQLSAS